MVVMGSDGRLAGRVALVTGAQQGIGAATALALGRAGASVVVNHLDDRAGGKAVAAEIREEGVEAVSVQGDVRSRDDLMRLVAAGVDLGGIDVLVNNAGIFPRVPFLDLTDDQWFDVLDVNLAGAFRCTQLVAHGLVGTGRPGSVINLASVAAYAPAPRGVHYAASKGGVVGLTHAAAVELAPHGIRVNAIAPGLTDTAQPRDGLTEAQIAHMSDRVPVGQMATPEDIADVAVFLASDDARHITGQVIHVNGGAYTV